MIKLDLPEKPIKLSEEIQKVLTELYKNEGKDVWNEPYIREAVLKIAYGKCCYSESILMNDSKYMEIDHFYSKKYFPEKVVEWGNLLPACKKCNISKGSHNTMIVPIINPCNDNPKEHLYIENFRFYGKTEKGKLTVDVVSLNDRRHFVDKRYKIGIKIIETLEDIKQNIESNKNKIIQEIRIKNRIFIKLKNLLNEGTKENEYSATISTIILQSTDYRYIRNFLNENNLWDDELEELEKELLFCALPKTNI